MVEDCGPCRSRKRRKRNPGAESDPVVVPFGADDPADADYGVESTVDAPATFGSE